jgi:hypothetical protein
MQVYQKVITGSHVAWFRDNCDSPAGGVEDCEAFWPTARVRVQCLRPNDWESVEPEDCIVVEVATRSQATPSPWSQKGPIQ